uniref:Uncharacterized protein n=1 Tax=Caenorhabditis tropicalis TaxID=1561998 RepID=A0A1I7T1E5_9PELO
MSDSSPSPLRSPEDEELLAKSSRIRLWVTKRMKELSLVVSYHSFFQQNIPFYFVLRWKKTEMGQQAIINEQY